MRTRKIRRGIKLMIYSSRKTNAAITIIMRSKTELGRSVKVKCGDATESQYGGSML